MPDVRIHRPLYRVFHLNRAGGIDWADIIEAIDDEDAIARVHALAEDHAVELWDRARFVAKVEPPLLALVPESPIVVRSEPDQVSTIAPIEAAAEEQKLVH